MAGCNTEPMNIFLVRRTFIVILTLFVANALASSVPNRAGLDEAKLREIPKRMQAFVDDSTIAGAVTLVARNGEVAALDAVGFADIAAHKPMRTDSLFWIASMTKPITATAVMILQEEGKLSID